LREGSQREREGEREKEKERRRKKKRRELDAGSIRCARSRQIDKIGHGVEEMQGYRLDCALRHDESCGAYGRGGGGGEQRKGRGSKISVRIDAVVACPALNV
jgi:hypothetical protein